MDRFVPHDGTPVGMMTFRADRSKALSDRERARKGQALEFPLNRRPTVEVITDSAFQPSIDQ